jgi:hypothetical protein
MLVAFNGREATMRHVIGTVILAIAAFAMTGEAVATGYPWRDHAAPYDFLFGNEIDTHQQTRARVDGALAGFLYVHYTGESTADGLPIALHEDCATTTCDVGWTVDGQPANAQFLYHVPDDHPVWLVERADIPQPGAYGHFHWLGAAPPPLTTPSRATCSSCARLPLLLHPSRHGPGRRRLLPRSRRIAVLPASTSRRI